MKGTFITFLFIFLGISVFTYGQENLSTDSRRAAKFYKKAEEYSSQRQLNKTLEYLEKAIDKDENFVEAYNKAGIYSKMLRKENKAKNYFYHVTQLRPNKPLSSKAYFYLSRYYLDKGIYDSCLYCVNKGIKFFRKNTSKFEKMEERREKCKFALKAKKDSLDVNPQSLSDTVNNLNFQYYPTLTADNKLLVFTGKGGKHFGNINYDENIFISKNIKGKWDYPKSISKNINTRRYNEGTCSISGDGKVLVLTICGKPDSYGSCDLYISYNEGGEWSTPENMGDNVNSSSWDSQPSLSADGKTLYFSSGRSGGFGNRDIWKCEADKYGKWNKAVNAGPVINTVEDDISPFFHPSRSTLYFASKGHLGMGSSDIFVSYKNENNGWSEPENLGYPVNTHLDESTFFVTSDGKSGYYSSEVRKGKKIKKFKIYKINIPDEISPKHASTYKKGIIKDAETGDKLKAQIELINLNTGKTVSYLESDPENGDYLVSLTKGKEYALYVSKKGYLFKSISFNLNKHEKFDSFKLNIALQPIKSNKSITLNNLFFETDKYKLSPKSKTELDKLIDFMFNNPGINVQISGYTDSIGTKSYNKELSEKRAKSVYEYLIENNIESTRVKYKGYGEANPAASNSTQESRRKNRRIELTILK